MNTVIKRCRGENKKDDRKIDGFRKKLMTPECEISECPEYKVISKIWNIFVNEKILEEYSVKVNKIDPYVYEHYKEKIQVDKNWHKYILWTDVYFTDVYFRCRNWQKKHAGRDHVFEDKRQEALKKLGCEFIRINKIKRYDENYEIGRIQTFISEL